MTQNAPLLNTIKEYFNPIRLELIRYDFYLSKGHEGVRPAEFVLPPPTRPR